MGKRHGWVRFPSAAILVFVGEVGLFLVVYLVARPILPPKQPIWLHPLW
jgi:hypothetical protein